MWYLFEHLEPGSFITCYADTDSMAIATTKTAELTENMTTEERYRAVFDPIVRPDKRASWEQTWKKWFVTTNTIEDGLTPGKLKCLSDQYDQVLIYVKVNSNFLREDSLR